MGRVVGNGLSYGGASDGPAPAPSYPAPLHPMPTPQSPLAGRPALLLALAAALAACTGSAGCADAPAPGAPAPAASGRPARGATAERTVRIDSLGIDVDSLRYTVRIGYPQVFGAPGTVNAAIRDSVVALAESFRPAEAIVPDVPAFENTTVWGGMDDVTLVGDLFSAVIQVYAYTGGAHGNAYFLPINVDLQTGEPVAFADVVGDGPAVRDTLAAYVMRAVVDRLMGHGDATLAEARQSVRSYNQGDVRIEGEPLFTLGADSLVVYEPPYAVMAYAFGAFRVPIAYADLQPFLRPGGPAPSR